MFVLSTSILPNYSEPTAIVEQSTSMPSHTHTPKPLVRAMMKAGYLSLFILPISEGFTKIADMAVSMQKANAYSMPFITFMSVLASIVSAGCYIKPMKNDLQEMREVVSGKRPEGWASYTPRKEIAVTASVALVTALASFIAAVETDYLNEIAADQYPFGFLAIAAVNNTLIGLTAANAFLNEGWEFRKAINDFSAKENHNRRQASLIFGTVLTLITMFEETVDGFVPLKKTFSDGDFFTIMALLSLSMIKALGASSLIGRIYITSIDDFLSYLANEKFNLQTTVAFFSAALLAGCFSYFLCPLSQLFYEEAFETQSFGFVLLSWLTSISATVLATVIFFPLAESLLETLSFLCQPKKEEAQSTHTVLAKALTEESYQADIERPLITSTPAISYETLPSPRGSIQAEEPTSSYGSGSPALFGKKIAHQSKEKQPTSRCTIS